ncbi:MAG: prepilin peptidase [bacterium]|nr:prepilin peptidase [bacterium]
MAINTLIVVSVLIYGGLGLIIGSFLNVLILRHDVRPLSGRSHCTSCTTRLKWFDLIPIISWIMLRGRCRTCRSAISIQYPLVEAGTALLFALIGTAFFQNNLLIFSTHSLLLVPYFAMTALLIAITVYDMRHMIIPDEWTFLFAGIALVTSLASYDAAFALTVLLSGPIVAAPLYLLWFVSRGMWMGLGDPKLALGMGWLLGPYVGLAAIFLAFIIGAIVSLLVLIPLSALRRRGEPITMKSEVPFGPFLVASTLILWLMTLYGIDPLFFS